MRRHGEYPDDFALPDDWYDPRECLDCGESPCECVPWDDEEAEAGRPMPDDMYNENAK